MYKTIAVYRFGSQFALLAAFALPACAGLVIPPGEWGSGLGSVQPNVNNYSGPSYCALSPSVSSCSQDIASNQPPNFLHSPDGTASGSVSASVDSNGAHVYASAGASGEGSSTSVAKAGFSDTVYNPTASAAQFQFTFHLDASLFTRSSSIAQLSLDYSSASLFQTQLSYGGAGTYSFVDQDFTTPLVTVAAGSYQNWSIVLTLTAAASSVANAQYLAGLPLSVVDAGNTLSLTGISVSDSQGNPITSSGLTSYYGFDYTASSTSAAPEPPSAGLFAGVCLLFPLVVCRGRRKS